MIVFICVYAIGVFLSWLFFRWERKVYYYDTCPHGPGVLGASLHYLDLLLLALSAVGILFMAVLLWRCFFLDYPIPFTDQLHVVVAGPIVLWVSGCARLVDPELGLLPRMLLALVLFLFWVFPIRRLLVVIALLKRPSTLSQKLLLPLYPLVVYWPESLLGLLSLHLIATLAG